MQELRYSASSFRDIFLVSVSLNLSSYVGMISVFIAKFGTIVKNGHTFIINKLKKSKLYLHRKQAILTCHINKCPDRIRAKNLSHYFTPSFPFVSVLNFRGGGGRL